MHHLISNHKRHSKRRTKRRVGLDELARVISLLLGHPFPDSNDLYVIPEDENQDQEDDLRHPLHRRGRNVESRAETAQSKKSNLSFQSTDIPEVMAVPPQSRENHRSGLSEHGQIGSLHRSLHPNTEEMDRLEIDDTRPTFSHLRSSFNEEIRPGLSRNGKGQGLLRPKLKKQVGKSGGHSDVSASIDRPIRGSSDSPVPMHMKGKSTAAEVLAEYGVNFSQNAIQISRSYRASKLEAMKETPDLPQIAPISLAQILSKAKPKKQSLSPIQASPQRGVYAKS